MSRTELRREWEDRLAEFEASGQTATAWCESHGIAPHRFWYWSRKLREAFRPKSIDEIRWLPVDIDESPVTEAGPLTIHIGHARIEVKRGFDPTLFTQVVQALSDAW